MRLITEASSFTPLSSTLWLPSGTPAKERRSQAAFNSAVHSLGWFAWMLIQIGP